MKMLKALTAVIFAAALPCVALAQSNPGWPYKFVPTPAQWNAAFSAKQDVLNYVPLNIAGGVMSGRLVTAPSSSAVAGLNLPQGSTPASPVNGDIWVSASGLFAQINGTTIGPFAGAGPGTFTATTPIAVTFPSAGVVNYALNFNSSLVKDGSNNLGINLANPNIWSGLQQFPPGDFHLLNSAQTGSMTLNAASAVATNIITFPNGTTDFSATGGASQVVKQTTSGGGFTVGQEAIADISGWGANVAAALGNPLNAANGLVGFSGAFGTPTSLTLTNATGLPNSGLLNSTISGISLGSNLDILTFGTHLAAGGTSYNGSAGVTISTDASSTDTTGNTLVTRAGGNFSAGTITASVTGHSSLDLPLTGGTMSGNIAMGSNAISGVTMLGMSGQLTSTLSTGTAPFSVASTTNVANLNASSLNGATFANPGPIGTTPSTGAFTTLSASGAVSGAGFSAYLASPPAIGGTAAAAGTFTTLSATGALTYGGVTLSNSVTGTGSMVLSSSPTFAGVPLAPTASFGTNTTQVATTAFVQSAVSGATAGVSSLNNQTGGLVLWPFPQGRLTLTSNTPVLTASVAGATTVYYTSYAGKNVPIYNGTAVAVYQLCAANTVGACELSAALGSNWVTNSNYDWFLTLNSGSPALCSGPAWTNNTARSAALAVLDGLQTNSASMTCRLNNTTTITVAANQGTYLGSMQTGSAGQTNYVFGAAASGGVAANFGLWNMYNRVLTGSSVQDNGASYTYATATVRQSRASAGNQASFIVGLPGDSLQFSYGASFLTVATSGAFAKASVGFDSTTSFAVSVQLSIFQTQTASTSFGSGTVAGEWTPSIGWHTLYMLEQSDGNANNFDAFSTNALNTIWSN